MKSGASVPATLSRARRSTRSHATSAEGARALTLSSGSLTPSIVQGFMGITLGVPVRRVILYSRILASHSIIHTVLPPSDYNLVKLTVQR